MQIRSMGVLYAAVVLTVSIQATEPTLSQEVVTGVTKLCKAPASSGDYLEYSAGGKLNVKFLSSGLKATITKKEWNGIQNVLKKQQLAENKNYRDCVTKLTPVIQKLVLTAEKKHPRPFPKTSSQKVLVGGIAEIALKGCQISSNTVICQFNVANTGNRDSYFTLAATNSFLFPDNGEKYKANQVGFGIKTSGDIIRKEVIQGVSYTSKLLFPKIPPLSQKVLKLEIAIMANNRWNKAVFRNLPLEH